MAGTASTHTLASGARPMVRDRLECQQTMAEHTCLQTTYGDFMAVRELDDIRAAWRQPNAPNGVDVDDAAARQTHEVRRIETTLDVLETVRHGMAFPSDRREMDELTFGNNGDDVLDGDEDDLVPRPYGDPAEIWLVARRHNLAGERQP